MTIESDLYTVLGPLVGNRVFFDHAPFNTTRPYIICQQIGGKPINYIDDASVITENAIMQIASWEDSRLKSTALAKSVEDSIRNSTVFSGRPDGGRVSVSSEELSRYGSLQDFSIWAAR